MNAMIFVAIVELFSRALFPLSSRIFYKVSSSARKNNVLEEKLTLLCRNKLLIIDELGFPLEGNDDWASLFYTLIAKRHEKLSTIITTNHLIKD